MSRTDRIWQHADAAFKEANKAFAEADRLFSEMPSGNGHTTFERGRERGKTHQLKFEARSGGERWRLTKKFFKMTLGVLFTGKAQLHFKDR